MIGSKKQQIGEKVIQQVQVCSTADLERLKMYEDDRQHMVVTTPEYEQVVQTIHQTEDEAYHLAQ